MGRRAVEPADIQKGADVLRIVARADRVVLSSVRVAVSEWLVSTDLTPDRSFDLVLAVNEAASNIVAHAYRDGSGTLEIEGKILDGAIVVRVNDRGAWRPWHATDGGRGYPMMRALVDSLEVSSSGSGTEVLLKQQC